MAIRRKLNTISLSLVKHNLLTTKELKKILSSCFLSVDGESVWLNRKRLPFVRPPMCQAIGQKSNSMSFQENIKYVPMYRFNNLQHMFGRSLTTDAAKKFNELQDEASEIATSVLSGTFTENEPTNFTIVVR